MRRTAVAGRWLAALAVVAAGLATGCSVVHPVTSTSGMENQIIKGEQVSAETRAQAARQVAGPAAAAAPAAGHARSRPPRAARDKVRGRQVTAIGDSVMAAGARWRCPPSCRASTSTPGPPGRCPPGWR
jgi:hypothetical protein